MLQRVYNNTQTTTISVAQEPVHTLYLRQPVVQAAQPAAALTPRQRVEAIIGRLLALPLTPEERVVITEWANTINHALFEQLENPALRSLAADALCDLLCTGLHPLVARIEGTNLINDEAIAEVLVDANETLQELLGQALPPEQDLDAYIDEYIKAMKVLEERNRQAQMSQERVRRVTAAMQAQLQRLEQAYDTTDAAFVAQFNNMRQRLVQFNSYREVNVSRLEGLLVDLTDTANGAVDRSVVQAERVKEQSKEIDETQQELNKLVERCNAAFDNAI